MFYNNPKYQEKFYNFVDRTENFEKKMMLLPVDFQKPWWDVIWREKKTAFIVAFTQLSWSIFDSVFPIMLGFAILRLDVFLFLVIMIARIFLTWFYNFTFSRNAIFQIQTMNSVEYSANIFFLTVDPLFHSTKSSGQIVSKINRGSSAYEDVLDIIGFDLLGIITSMVTIIVTMFAFSFQLGLISFLFLTFITAFNILTQIYRTKIFQPRKILAEDKFKAVSIETLIQAPFLRAIFASSEQSVKLKKSIFDAMIKEGNSWQAGTYVGTVTRTVYIISIVVIGYTALLQAKNGLLEATLALSIILAYANGTQNILYTGDKVKRLTTALSNINDLFDFIRGFGKQTFPVLDEDKQWQSANTTKTIPS